VSQEDTNQRIAYFRKLAETGMEKVARGVTRWLDGRLKEIEEGHLVGEFVVRDDMVNPMNVLHGGAAAMIMDEMMGLMVYLLGFPNAHTSVNLNCDFLHPAPVGSVLTATADVIRKGKNIVHCECRIEDSEGRLIAKAASNLIITPVPIDLPGQKIHSA